MREFDFRGKDYDGQWKYGSLMTYEHFGSTVYEIITCPPPDFDSCRVKEESIGQFTGLQDKNGRDIYEGDIVQWSKDGRRYVVTFRSGMFYASVGEFNPGIHGGFPLWVLCEEEQPCVIVGNVFLRETTINI